MRLAKLQDEPTTRVTGCNLQHACHRWWYATARGYARFALIFLCEGRVFVPSFRARHYDVIQCESTEAAELVLEKSAGALRLLMTDEQLAGRMDGVELAYFAMERNPRLDVVVTSGRPLTQPDEAKFWAKPWAPPGSLAGGGDRHRGRSPVAVVEGRPFRERCDEWALSKKA